jgi:hypothetical protein
VAVETCRSVCTRTLQLELDPAVPHILLHAIVGKCCWLFAKTADPKREVRPILLFHKRSLLYPSVSPQSPLEVSRGLVIVRSLMLWSAAAVALPNSPMVRTRMSPYSVPSDKRQSSGLFNNSLYSCSCSNTTSDRVTGPCRVHKLKTGGVQRNILLS